MTLECSPEAHTIVNPALPRKRRFTCATRNNGVHPFDAITLKAISFSAITSESANIETSGTSSGPIINCSIPPAFLEINMVVSSAITTCVTKTQLLFLSPLEWQASIASASNAKSEKCASTHPAARNTNAFARPNSTVTNLVLVTDSVSKLESSPRLPD